MQQSLVSLLLCYALTALLVLVLARVVLSWFPPGGSVLESAQRFVFGATEWMMGPLRRIIPPLQLGGAALDLSPIVIFLVIGFLRGIVCR
jgi:YggT family protein